jgi:hypothetical protein
MWLFRWPIRLIEYMYLGAGIMLALLLSAGLATDKFKQRALTTGVLIAIGWYLSNAVRPEIWRMHTVATVLVALLVFGAIFAYRKRGWLPAGAVLLAGTIGVVAFQTSRIPFNGPGSPVAIEPAHVVSKIESGTASYKGTYLQLAQLGLVRNTSDSDDGKILFGHLSVLTGHESITRYSGIGFAEFTNALCMDYRGAVCKEAYDKLWQNLPDTNVRLIDAMRVETLVLQNALYPEIAKQPQPGWSVATRDSVRTVWTRNAPLPHPGRVSWTTSGTTVTSADVTSERFEKITFRGGTGGGKIMFARLAWPGYTATVDGQTVPVQDGPAGMIVVDVPAGQHTLELEYVAPGIKLGIAAGGAATLVALVQAFLWWRGNRRSRRRSGPQPQVTPEGATEVLTSVS